MSFTTGTLGTASTTSLTKAIVWGLIGEASGLTAANYNANYVPCLADLNASFRYNDSYDSSQEEYIGAAGSEVNYQWAAIHRGILYYPGGRGMLKLYPGDMIACDTNTGWPVLINAATRASNKWHVVPNV